MGARPHAGDQGRDGQMCRNSRGSSCGRRERAKATPIGSQGAEGRLDWDWDCDRDWDYSHRSKRTAPPPPPPKAPLGRWHLLAAGVRRVGKPQGSPEKQLQ